MVRRECRQHQCSLDQRRAAGCGPENVAHQEGVGDLQGIVLNRVPNFR
jgi:hypothetical protein